ncbi:uncharacterized protein FIESC28_03956 [Fusarium coffeatum]|uniref:2EXR domain-containing protein n=1 Tax=Fusarium coffeatum TaxID=231269 RepID=A0A366S1P6_9HYPO|nr:uncharacterized protein FIESC28_03956 [Fusarium coffeatum]RBR23214.1 hypothetical protein FIESC28_03956 [Fusarium coffeatum]
MERPSFAILPPELRYKIYLFATPPRYVYLRGHGDPAEDLDESLPVPSNVSASPSTLGPYSTPDERVYFTSATQIPPLLHTCRESRDYLMGQGYELTFAARKCKQRTWFNYKKDILIVPVLPKGRQA